ncbi:MAG: hypothetical protein JWO41_869 [Candidatus Saccharibacteria bacterium]|nr:hypothetical protein [Candidatus Saccharibacteria bacterium]
MSRGDSVPMVSQQLLLSVAEQLKLPLLQIARQAELASLHAQPNLGLIQSTADTALRLIDGYVLGVRLNLEQSQLDVEPVSVSSILYDTGQELDAIAKAYGVSLELNIAGRYGPVMAHKQGLQTALVSLGVALIEALPATEAPQLKLQLAAYRCRYGIVAGLYSETEQLSLDALRQGRRLQGKVRQPLAQHSHTSGAGIFVADALLAAMDLKLQLTRHHGLFGLGTVLEPNNQLQLV